MSQSGQQSLVWSRHGFLSNLVKSGDLREAGGKHRIDKVGLRPLRKEPTSEK